LLPEPITALAEGNNRNLVVAMGSQIYSLNLDLESIDKSPGTTTGHISSATRL
jgi:hypothetical protein